MERNGKEGLSSIGSHVVFGPVYIVVGLLLSIPLIPIPQGVFRSVLDYSALVIAAPVAIVLVQRFGRLSARGLLVTGCVWGAVCYLLIWGILQRLALGAGQSIPIWRIATEAGWSFALSLAIVVLAPAVCFLLLPHRRSSGMPELQAS